MKEKVLVTYSVRYCKEIELEVNEEIKDLLNDGQVIDWKNYSGEYFYLQSQKELEDLPIPTLYSYDSKFGQEFENVEYVDGSFDIETFEKQL